MRDLLELLGYYVLVCALLLIAAVVLHACGVSFH